MTTELVMSITDEQIAEIERFCDMHEVLGVNSKKLLSIISRLRAAERDAARYRFLKTASPDAHMWSDESLDAAMKGEQQ